MNKKNIIENFSQGPKARYIEIGQIHNGTGYFRNGFGFRQVQVIDENGANVAANKPVIFEYVSTQRNYPKITHNGTEGHPDLNNRSDLRDVPVNNLTDPNNSANIHTFMASFRAQGGEHGEGDNLFFRFIIDLGSEHKITDVKIRTQYFRPSIRRNYENFIPNSSNIYVSFFNTKNVKANNVVEYTDKVDEISFPQQTISQLNASRTLVSLNTALNGFFSLDFRTLNVLELKRSGTYTLTTDTEFEASGETPIIIPKNAQDKPELSNNKYIILGTDDITIKTDDIITKNNPILVGNNWAGLFENGTADADGRCDNYNISNIHIKLQSGNLVNGSGGIFRSHFGKGKEDSSNKIQDCSFEGVVSDESGGICGSNFVDKGYTIIRRCFTKGNINGTEAGGICGARAAHDNGVIYMEYCYSEGNIQGTDAGGIYGSECAKSGGDVTIRRCYSLGNIETTGAGICGKHAATSSGRVEIVNSFVRGNIVAGGFGLIGQEAGHGGGSITIKNCLYNSQGCQNGKLADLFKRTGEVIDNDSLKKSINVHDDHATVEIKNTNYFGDMDDFHERALLSINKREDNPNQNLGDGAWVKCPASSRKHWLFEGNCNDIEAITDNPCVRLELTDNRITIEPGSDNKEYVLTRDSEFEDSDKIPIYISETEILGENALIFIDSNNITITTDNTITHENPIIVPDGWNGLIETATYDVSGQDTGRGEITIRDIHIKCVDDSGNIGKLTTFQGGICKANFSQIYSGNNNIENCSFQGNIGASSGGICGNSSCVGSNLQISNCFTIGNIDSEGGGICGNMSNFDNLSGYNTNLTISKCYFKGTIGTKAGGICGSNSCMSSNGTLTISGCYAIGNVGADGGGIIGNFDMADFGVEGSVIIIENSFHLGDLGNNAGAITGSDVGLNQGELTIKNCLYKYPECETGTVTSMASTETSFATGNEKFKSIIGSLASDFKKITISNTHFIADMDFFHSSANLSIDRSIANTWNKCSRGGHWLLMWQGDDDIVTPTQTCEILPEGDDTCLNVIELKDKEIPLRSGDYILSRNKSFQNSGRQNYTLITFDEPLDINGFLTLTQDNITITCDQNDGAGGEKAITHDNPIRVPDGWEGLIQNGSANDANCDNYQISNIHLHCLKDDGNLGSLFDTGGICKNFFGYGKKNGDNKIENCSFHGVITNYSGGICGGNMAGNGNVTIKKCFSRGIISGESSGGICGLYCGFDEGTMIINNCFSEGSITGYDAGGICGSDCGKNYTGHSGSNGNVRIQYCYSLGDIDGENSGGICGNNAGKVTIENCYSKGNILKASAGGICGGSCAKSDEISEQASPGSGSTGGRTENGTVVIRNCLYNFDECENGVLTSMASTNRNYATNNDKFKRIIGSLASDFISINIHNCHYFADMDDFYSRAELSIMRTAPDNTWIECPGRKHWLLGALQITNCESITEADDTCKERYELLNSSIDLESGKYIITRTEPYVDTTGEGWTPIYYKQNKLGTGAVIVLKEDNIQLKCDSTITADNPILVPTSWQGLIQNGSDTAAGECDNYHITDIHIKCVDVDESNTTISNLTATHGGICQAYFGKEKRAFNNKIERCSFEGIIYDNGGGIVGRSAGSNRGTLTLNDCFSKGVIRSNAGGICGSNTGEVLGSVTVNNCYSIANIPQSGVTGAGGICGSNSGSGGMATINNCYSISALSSDNGGICGGETASQTGNVIIKNCLYNYEGCDNILLSQMVLSQVVPRHIDSNRFKQIIGGLSTGFQSVNIKNCHYFGDISDFYDRALISINKDESGNDLPLTKWKKCQDNKHWLLNWESDCNTLDIEYDIPVCSTTSISRLVLYDQEIILNSGDYVITRQTEYTNPPGENRTPIYLEQEILTKDAVIILNENRIDIKCDTTITPTNPINVAPNWQWTGLFSNGTETEDGKCDDYQITDIHLKSNVNFPAADSGCIFKSYFGKGKNNQNNKIERCSYQGPVSGSGGGGICGPKLACNNGKVSIKDCFTKGDTPDDSGGICGSECGFNNGTVNITTCYSTGNIGSKAGGICGKLCARNHGTVNINNCYSNRRIDNPETGGICGFDACKDNGKITITNCLYNITECDNARATNMVSMTTPTFGEPNSKFRNIIGSLSNDFGSINISNTHFFGNDYDFHNRATLSIAINVPNNSWIKCDNNTGKWLLHWEGTLSSCGRDVPNWGNQCRESSGETSSDPNSPCSVFCDNASTLNEICKCKECCFSHQEPGETCIEKLNLFSVYDCN